MFTSYNKANIILVSHILMLLHLPKSQCSKWAKYEKLEKYWSCCTRNRAITNAYLILDKEIFHTQLKCKVEVMVIFLKTSVKTSHLNKPLLVPLTSFAKICQQCVYETFFMSERLLFLDFFYQIMPQFIDKHFVFVFL